MITMFLPQNDEQRVATRWRLSATTSFHANERLSTEVTEILKGIFQQKMWFLEN